jgi:hypothetical protein
MKKTAMTKEVRIYLKDPKAHIDRVAAYIIREPRPWRRRKAG